MSSDPMVGQDEGTQQMVREARENFPDRPQDEALQQQAELGAGREATQGEGGGATGVVESVKEAASSAAEAVKQALPATRDMKRPGC